MTLLGRIAKIALRIFVFVAAAGVSTYLTVHFLIRGQHTVVVPELAGKEVIYALEVLTDLGLNTKVKEVRFHPSVPKHHIISQEPSPGDEIKRGRDVRLTISRGPRAVIFPNLAGLGLPQAGIIIDQNGLGQVHISRTFHDTVPREEVITQYPRPGASGVRGDRIHLLVSAGLQPKPIQMMDLTGMELNEAIHHIESNHLRVGTITVENHSESMDDTVLSHAPPAGYPVEKGSTVNLTINRQANTSLEDMSTQKALFRYRTPQGFLRRQVRVKISQQRASYTIFDAFVKPGKEIWLIIPGNSATTLFLYVDGELVQTKHYH